MNSTEAGATAAAAAHFFSINAKREIWAEVWRPHRKDPGSESTQVSGLWGCPPLYPGSGRPTLNGILLEERGGQSKGVREGGLIFPVTTHLIKVSVSREGVVSWAKVRGAKTGQSVDPRADSHTTACLCVRIVSKRHPDDVRLETIR